MATVQTIIDDARYDLEDYETGLMWDDAELLNYLNRMIRISDSLLAVLNSDLIEEEEEGIDTVADQDYVDLSNLNSGNWDSIRQVWIGQNLVYKISLDLLRYKRMFRSGSQRPYYYALHNRKIMFETNCDQAYTDFVIYYNKKTGALALDDDMPYDDTFNEFIRAQLVTYAATKKGEQKRGDSYDLSIFRKRMNEEVVRRFFNPKPYYLGF